MIMVELVQDAVTRPTNRNNPRHNFARKFMMLTNYQEVHFTAIGDN